LPDFEGCDRTYSLSKEDVITLPREIALALIEAGKAEKIDL
jgi:hypothetical protein